MMMDSEERVDSSLLVSDVTKAYGTREVLGDFSITIRPGRVHALLGSNGSGKSTALHIITGITDSDRGEVLHEGIPVIDQEARRRFGFAPDDLAIPLALTGTEFLAMHSALRGRNDQARGRELARVFGISRVLDQPMSSYSHGMKRKLQIVTAVMHQPGLLILDEPFRGLDPDASGLLVELIALQVETGGSVLMATHDLLRAERHCDEITMLHAGRVIAQGSPVDMTHEHGSLAACFAARSGSETDVAERSAQLRTLIIEGND